MSDRAASRRSGPAWLAVGLLGLVVLLVVATTLLALRVRAEQRTVTARAQAMHAARLEAVNLVTLDYRHLDTDLANVLAGATGDFHDQYAKGAEQVKRVVTANQVTSTGSILESGVVSGDPDSVTILVVVDSTVRNKADQKGQPRHYRMKLEMLRQGSRWRASSLEFVA